MKSLRRPRFSVKACALALCLVACCCYRIAGAQDPAASPGPAYPARSIQLVAPFPPGGGIDVVGRLIAQKLAENLKTPFVIDNRAGFSGNIGAQYVAKAPADGHTLLVAALTTYSINAALYRSTIGYDLGKDFAPVSIVGTLPLVLIVNSSLPANTLQQLIALAKARPGQLSFASAGNGSIEHATGELFKRLAGVDMFHVPYKGSSPALTDLLGGQVFTMFATMPNAVANLKGKRIKSIAVLTPQRLTPLPEVPTTSEAGLPGMEVSSIFGLLALAGTPRAVIDRLNCETMKGLEHADLRERFALLGIVPTYTTPEDTVRRIHEEIAKWARVIREANIKAE